MKIFVSTSIVCIFLAIGCENIVEDNIKYDYSIEQKVSCFYCPSSDEWFRLFISADTVVAVFNVTDNLKLSSNEIKNFKSIKQLDDIIVNTDTNTYKILFNFDNQNFPSYLFLDPKPIVENDTIVYVFTDAWIVYRTQNYIKYNN